MIKKNIKIVFSIIILIILFLTVKYKTLSRYKNNYAGNGQLHIARWNIVVNSQSSNITIDLEDTIAENSFSNSSVIPGTNGVLILNFDFSELDVSADYILSIDRDNSNLPPYLRFYTDSSYTDELPYRGTYNITDGNSQSVYIYWKWLYVDSNENEWMDSNIYVTFDLDVSQKISG